MTDLDGGSNEDSHMGNSLISFREDTNGSPNLVMEKTERPMVNGNGAGPGNLVSGRQAGKGWDLSGY